MQCQTGAELLRRSGRWIGVCAAMVALSGCGGLAQRGADFVDIWGLEAGFCAASPGIELQLTDLVHTGLGGGLFTDSYGIPAREPYRRPNSEVGSAYLIARQREPLKSGPRRGGWLWNVAYIGDYFSGDTKRSAPACFSYPKVPWIGLLDCEVEVYLFPLDLRLAVRFGQAIDFVAGFFGADPAQDDVGDAPRDGAETDRFDRETNDEA